MTAHQIALNRQKALKRLSKSTTTDAARLWANVDGSIVMSSWARLLPRLYALLSSAQYLGASTADSYVDSALRAQGIVSDPYGPLDPQSFVGYASDGRPLESMLMVPAVTTVAGIRQGMLLKDAMAYGAMQLGMMVRTQIADAWRVPVGTATVGRRGVTTYVRMLTPPSCSRCAVLAGAYSARTAFQRHPRCDCVAVPSSEDTREDFRTDPLDYFNSLDRHEQDKIFTHAGAQAIRDGANIARVVNARRKAFGLSPAQGRGSLQAQKNFGSYDYLTSELQGTLRGSRGQVITRLMPESIYADTRSIEETIRMLKLHGYII